MAKSITQLDPLTGLANNDLMEVVDMSETRLDKKNKKVEMSVLAAFVAGLVNVDIFNIVWLETEPELKLLDVSNADDYPDTGENQKLFLVKPQSGTPGIWVLNRDDVTITTDILDFARRDLSNQHTFYNLLSRAMSDSVQDIQEIKGGSAPFVTLAARNTHYTTNPNFLKLGMLSYIYGEAPVTQVAGGGRRKFFDTDRNMAFISGPGGSTIVNYEHGTVLASYNTRISGIISHITSALSPDKKFFITTGRWGEFADTKTGLRIIDTYTFEVVETILGNVVRAVAFVPTDPSKVLVAFDNVLVEYSIDAFGKLTLLRQVTGVNNWGQNVIFSSDNTQVIFTDYDTEPEAVASGALTTVLAYAGFTFTDYDKPSAFSADRTKSVLYNGGIKTFTTHTGTAFGATTATFVHTGNILTFRVTNSGKVYVLTQANNGDTTLIVYNHTTGATITTIALPHKVDSLGMSEDESLIFMVSAIGTGTSIFKVVTATDALTTIAGSYGAWEYPLEISPDNKILIGSPAYDKNFVYHIDKNKFTSFHQNGVYQLATIDPQTWVIPSQTYKYLKGGTTVSGPDDDEDEEARTDIAQIKADILDLISLQATGSVAIDLSLYPHKFIPITSHTTFTVSNEGNARTATYYIRNTSGSTWNLTYPAGAKWFGGIGSVEAPTIANNTRIIFTLVCVPILPGSTFEIWCSVTPETIPA